MFWCKHIMVLAHPTLLYVNSRKSKPGNGYMVIALIEEFWARRLALEITQSEVKNNVLELARPCCFPVSKPAFWQALWMTSRWFAAGHAPKQLEVHFDAIWESKLKPKAAKFFVFIYRFWTRRASRHWTSRKPRSKYGVLELAFRWQISNAEAANFEPIHVKLSTNTEKLYIPQSKLQTELSQFTANFERSFFEVSVEPSEVCLKLLRRFKACEAVQSDWKMLFTGDIRFC